MAQGAEHLWNLEDSRFLFTETLDADPLLRGFPCPPVTSNPPPAQFVFLNGRDHVKGADVRGIYDRLDAFKREGQGLNVPVASKFAGDEVEIDIGAGSGKADVVVAYFTREQTVDVQKGENQGKKMSYWHSVYDVQTVGMWDGSPMTVKLPASVVAKVKKGGCAVLLQTANASGDPAAIVGASILLGNETP